MKTHPLATRALRGLMCGLQCCLMALGCGPLWAQVPTPSAPAAAATPAPPARGLPPLHTQGTQWLQPDSSPARLRGVNLGNWLIPEFWMMGYDEHARVNDQCTLESVLDQRFGRAERERLIQLHRANWITGRDWDLIQRFGLNLVRLPFIWSVLEDEQHPRQLRPDAWTLLDNAVAEAGRRGIYVVLDLHGAVGAQGTEHHAGCANLNRYWTTPEYQERTLWLWQQIARHYQGNGTVAAYDLLNEPWGSTPEALAQVMQRLYKAVREVDADHIILLPDHVKGGIAAYGRPADQGMRQVAFETHPYPGFFGWGKPGREVHRDWLQCRSPDGGVCRWRDLIQAQQVPLFIGEFQPWADLAPELSGQVARASYDRYTELGFASAAWAYKKLSRGGGRAPVNWGLVTNARSAPVPDLDFHTASLAQIEAFFKHFGSMAYEINEPVLQAMTSAQPAQALD